LICYLFQIKDRHNGNILLDAEGHVIHIDFGFLLGRAPGGPFSIETAPFKLTAEMVAALGGLRSRLFLDFMGMVSKGFLALQAAAPSIMAAVEIVAEQSSFPCFAGRPSEKAAILDKLRQRLRPHLDRTEAEKYAMSLVKRSYDTTLTRAYDRYQFQTQGISP